MKYDQQGRLKTFKSDSVIGRISPAWWGIVLRT